MRAFCTLIGVKKSVFPEKSMKHKKIYTDERTEGTHDDAKFFMFYTFFREARSKKIQIENKILTTIFYDTIVIVLH